MALGGNHVYVGDGRAYEIEVYDLAGNPLPPLAWDGPALDYDRELVRRRAEQAVSEAPEASRASLRRWYLEMPELDRLPAYDRIVVSDTDEVWVRQFVRTGSAGEEWVVFGADHRLIGRITLPARATLWEVRQGRVVHSVLDDLDVPIVRISRVER